MENLTLFLEDYTKFHSPGYVIEIYNQGKEEEITFGNREIKPNLLPCNSNTLYDIASLTKTFTATLIYLAYEENKLDIYDTVFKIDSRFSHLKEVTLLDLLSHNQEIWTNGYLGNAKNKQEFYEMLFSSQVKSKTPTYVDVHYIILSTILEKIYNKTFDKLLKEKIVEKLKMKETTVNPRGNNIASNNYEMKDGTIIKTNELGLVHDQKARKAKELGITTGHASIFTTGKDLLLFLKSFFDGTLLKKETIEWMLKHDRRNEYNEDVLSPFLINGQVNPTYQHVKNKVTCVKTYNYMGARYFNNIEELNDVPFVCSKNTIVFTGFTGPLYMMDFDKKIIVIIMCNVMHNTRLSRDERKKGTEQILEKICETIY